MPRRIAATEKAREKRRKPYRLVSLVESEASQTSRSLLSGSLLNGVALPAMYNKAVQLQRLPLSRPDRLNLFAELAQSHGNHAMQRFQAGQLAVANPRSLLSVQRKEHDEKPAVIGYVGLNPQARKEARALEKAADARVIVSLDDPKAQERLKTDQGIEAFVASLGISPEDNEQQYDDALDCLKQADPRFRDQMAKMMEMFHGAELGHYRLERLVLSGHHSGGTLWRGRPPDIFQKEAILSLRTDLNNLVETFPEAREQVEDVMFSACNTEDQIDLCRELFPNLRSVWAYAGASPSIAQGSDRDITKWEKKTRGERLPGKKDETGHILIWTKESTRD